MNAIETRKVGKYTIEFSYDDLDCNPRTQCDNDTLMLFFHKKYNLGDTKKNNYRSQDFSNWDEMEAQIIKDHQPVVIKPVFLYDHSGLTIATSPFSCRWDSGQIGFVLMPKKSAYAAYGVKRITKAIKEKCEQYIDSDIKVYDQYLRGDVYCYVIKDEDY